MAIVFNNIDDIPEMKEWDGKEITILEVLANPEGDHNSDPSSLPLLRAKLCESGEVKNIYPEEINKEHWPAKLVAALDGMLNYLNEKNADMPEDQDLVKYYLYGEQCARYRI